MMGKVSMALDKIPEVGGYIVKALEVLWNITKDNPEDALNLKFEEQALNQLTAKLEAI
jgi:hypothetical protein